MKTISSLLLLCVMALFGTISMRADEKDDYKLFADEIRSAVYAMDLPEFEIKEIPEKYDNESAVFVAIYHELNASKKTGFGRLPGTLRFSAKARVEGGELCRMLIHINDKVALEKFSEFDFATDIKKKMSNAHRKQRHVMGVRVIKSDGKQITVNTDDFVEIEDGKDKRNKLAVPGLEVGDNIDVFFYTEHRLQNVHLEPMTYYLRDIYPIMNYRIHAVVDDNLTTQYRTLNGAPDFRVGRDEDKNYVLDIELKDIPAEARKWYSSIEQSPIVKMYVYNRRSDAYTPPSARKDGLQQNPEVAKIKDDVWFGRSMFIEYNSGPLSLKGKLKNGPKAYKNIRKQFKDGKIDTVAMADYLYNLLTFAYYVSDANLYPLRFDVEFGNLLDGVTKKLYTTVLTTDADEEDVSELASMFNAVTGAKLVGGQRYYLPPMAIMSPSELHPDYIGRRAQVYFDYDYRHKHHPECDSVYFYLPESTSSDNRNVSEVKVKVDGIDLKVDRRESCIGSTKIPVQGLLSEEDVVNAYLCYLNRDGVEIELQGGRKKADDRSEKYVTERSLQQDAFKEEVEDVHSGLPIEFESGKIVQVGVDPASPELVYNVKYKIADLLKTAGKNMIFSVGKLLGGQNELLESDRSRTDDVIMVAPREFITKIDIELPTGYQISEKTLNDLKRNVENASGLFAVEPSVENGHLHVDITKRYNHKRESASAWKDLVEIIDAAAEWQAATCLLEKQ
ncbi:MAG: hypothetical protein J6B44_01680 [Muribaculaceae bacterium]|nr:hypothetical protein [Muribaculaceae bacterium]